MEEPTGPLTGRPRPRRRNILPWMLLALYAAVIAFMAWWLISETYGDGWEIVAVGAPILVVSQVVLLSSVGMSNLCRPITQRRLILPALIATLMMVLLTFGLALSMIELFDAPVGLHPWPYVFWALVGVSWFAWGTLIYAYTRGRDPYSVLKRIAILAFAGSLLQLLATIPSHVIVSRRPGCFVGLLTLAGLVAGLCVMLWSFGPAILLLLIRPKWKDQREETKDAGN